MGNHSYGNIVVTCDSVIQGCLGPPALNVNIHLEDTLAQRFPFGEHFLYILGNCKLSSLLMAAESKQMNCSCILIVETGEGGCHVSTIVLQLFIARI